MKASVSFLVLFLALVTPAFAQQVATLTLRSNDLIYDGTRGKLYASVPGSWGADGNSIAVIDPRTGTVDTYIPVGSEPNRLALSDDGQFLHVGLDGAFAVACVDLGTLTTTLSFTLGTSQQGEPFHARDLAVVPGSPQSVAVLRATSAWSSTSLAVYDAGLPRPAVVSANLTSLAFADPGTLYASGDDDLSRLLVHELGVFTMTTSEGLLGSGARVVFEGNRLYATTRHVVEAASLGPLGVLSSESAYPWSLVFTDIAPDDDLHAVYAVWSASGSTVVRAYSAETFTPLWSFRPSGVLGSPGRLVRWGPSGLAFRTDQEQVFLVDFGGGRVLTVAKAGFGNGTVTSTPAAINCGVDCVALLPDLAAVTLAVEPRSGSRFAGWLGDPDCLDGSVTMTAAKTCTAVFEPTAADAIVSLPVTANDLVYSGHLGRILASIPGASPTGGNTITAINPLTGQVGPSVWVGSEPNRLALSDDGQYLYVRLDGAGAVRRLNLGTFQPGPQFWIGRPSDSLMDLAVAPGQPDTIAVIRSDETVAVFDAGIPRPVTTNRFKSIRALSFAGSSLEMYGYSGDSILYRIAALDSGVYIFDEIPYLISGSSPRILFDSGRLYADTGRVVDPGSRTVLGTFPAVSPSSLALDPVGGAVFMLHRPAAGWTVSRYDPQRFTLLESLTAPGVTNTPRSFISAGAGCVAFLARDYAVLDGDLFLATVRPNAAPVAARGDFDGDGKADPGIFRGPDGTWWLQSSSGGAPRGIVWGLETDLPVPADYDGDGAIDIAVFRPSNGRWYLLLSSSGYTTADSFQWGTSGDLPAPGDWDGDGAAEAAVFRPSTGEWFLRLTPGSAIVHARYRWGADGDVPAHADYDGDGTVDLAVYRPSTGFWHVRYSTANYALGSSWQWGVATDVPVPGDWDGDGRADAAVYRPATGQWFLRLPGAWPVQWGAPGDVPVPADYDGDRRLDIAVYRPSTGMWYVRGLFTRAWGAPGDTPVTGR